MRDLKTLLSANVAFFVRYRKGELVYELMESVPEGDARHTGAAYVPLSPPFEFVVPVSEAGDGVFNATEKPITLMRYIRKTLESMSSED